MPLPDDLAARLAPRIEPVPDYPGVYVRTLTADAGVAFLAGEQAQDDLLIYLALHTLCDEHGVRFFSRGEEDKVRALPLEFVAAAGARAADINGITGDDENPSEGGPDGGSPSA
jgi:hypothetical protein